MNVSLFLYLPMCNSYVYVTRMFSWANRVLLVSSRVVFSHDLTGVTLNSRSRDL